MASKETILKGLWDCPYCGQKGISGLTKSCPNCAHPQDAGTKFYLGSVEEKLEEDKAKEYGKGADWTCAFCGSLNRYYAENCQNCGAERADSSGDYFENRRKEEAAQKPQTPPPPPPKKKRGLLLAVLLAIVALIVFVALPRSRATTVTDKTWERAIVVESLNTVRESDWSVPNGAANVVSGPAIHHYEQVLDHYEDQEYQVPKEVLDGYDTVTETVDNGDGTFTKIEKEVPRYRTEYETRTRTVPVYRQEPVYATRYEYDIDRWQRDHVEYARGSGYEPKTEGLSRDLPVDPEPYWPELRLGERQREMANGRSEQYVLYFTDNKGKRVYAAVVSQQVWENYKRGDAVKLEVQGSRVLTLDGQRVLG